MKKLIAALAAFAALTTTRALAQEQQPTPKLEMAPYVGTLLPTGKQRDLLEDSVLTGLILSYDVHPYVAVVGSFGWAPAPAKGSLSGKDLNLFQYDVGAQGQYPFHLGDGITLKPFLGVGAGARNYNPSEVDSRTDFAGYFSLGGDLEYRKVAVGVTARDYLSHFGGIGGEEVSTTRNDVAVLGSLGLRF